MKTLIITLIFGLVTVSKVASQCCDFQVTACTWQNSGFELAPTVLPNTVSYPYFTATEPSPYYMWLQDNSASATTENTFTIPGAGTLISFDIFFNSPTADSINYMTVFFNNVDGSVSQIYYGNAMTNNWQHQQITCDASNYYCCGGSNKLPCSGNLQINVYLDPNYRLGLFAVDNIGTCSSGPPTLPPPTPASCCHFETDTCGMTANEWYWSATSYPSGLIPPYDGHFLWTEYSGATAITATQSAVTPYTTFTFDYFVGSTYAQLVVYFTSSYGSIDLAYLPYTGGVWTSTKVQCLSCCRGGTCDGQVGFLVDVSVGIGATGIDNFQRDGSCDGSFTCCYFDDSSMCGFTTQTVNGYQWRFYGTSAPTYPITYPGSAYVYIEFISYPYPTETSVTLTSQSITIGTSTVFQGSIYIYNPEADFLSNALYVSFVNVATGITTQIDYMKSTGGSWSTMQFDCDSTHGNCCQGATSCQGYLEITAYVVPYGGTVQYAVDAFEVLNTCSYFPGGTANGTSIEFHPQSA